MSQRRVVITGMGCVTSLGYDVPEVWEAVCAGRSGIKTITKFDTAEYTTKIGGEVSDWTGGKHLEPRDGKRLDRFAQYAINAAQDAVDQSGIDFEKENPWRCGSIIGSGVGGIEAFATGHETLMTKGPARVSPFMVPKLMCNAGSGNVSIRFGIKGPNSAVASACASAAHAIGDAVEAIRHNAADVMITGGSEAALTPMGLACFIALKALSRRNDDPEHASRPWDKDRDGFLLAEGAGILAHRGVRTRQGSAEPNILAEIAGWGQSADGYHITAPDEEGRGAAEAMELALTRRRHRRERRRLHQRPRHLHRPGRPRRNPRHQTRLHRTATPRPSPPPSPSPGTSWAPPAASKPSSPPSPSAKASCRPPPTSTSPPKAATSTTSPTRPARPTSTSPSATPSASADTTSASC